MPLDNSPRKGIPIKSPHERLGARRSTSSHDLLSPLNTLDVKRSSKTSQPVAKPSTTLPRTSMPAFPLKVDKLPFSFTNGSRGGSFDTLVSRYPTGTFCTEASEETFKNVTVKRGSSLNSSNSSDHFDITSAYASDDEKTSVKSKIVSKITSFSDQKVINVSTIQYRHLIIPPHRSPHEFSSFKLIFVQKERYLVLSCKVNNSQNSSVLHIQYSKVLRIQFIRKECQPSSDWYIDFVLAPDTPVDLKSFKAPPDSSLPSSHIETFCNFSTLRVCLDSNCGASVHALDNILLSILNDRKAFYFSDIKDQYGEYEGSDRTSSPSRPLGRSFSGSPSTSKSLVNSSPRFVPSLETLSASVSVKIKSRRNDFIENNQIYSTKSQSSPDVFEKRQSKRIRTTSSPQTKEVDFAYVDPEFESDCVKLFSYPEGDLDSVQVTSHELQRLEPGIWLNDTLIDFELKFLLHQLDKSLREKVHIFSSFFYRRLSSAKITPAKSEEQGTKKKTGFELVKTWTRKVNLFEKDFVVIPINENLHWYLAIICHPSKMLAEDNDNEQNDSLSDNSDDVPFVDLDAENNRARIFIFDSLGLTSRGKSTAVINKLRSYLQLEAQDKLGKSSSKAACTGHVIKVPQQENFTDCGCFLLQFVEEFFKKDLVEEMIELNYDLSDWFPPQKAQTRRNVMKERIRILAADYASRMKMKQGTEPIEKEPEEDCSSDIEEIIM